MLRRLAIFVVSAMLPTFAVAGVPSDVNLHNGYVIVVNHVHYAGEKTLPFDITYVGLSTLNRKLAAGSYATFNQCCVVAGQTYHVYARTEQNHMGVNPNIPVHARLCNIRGIPFGYAEVELVGNVTYHQSTVHPALGDFDVTGVAIRQIDTGCP